MSKCQRSSATIRAAAAADAGRQRPTAKQKDPSRAHRRPVVPHFRAHAEEEEQIRGDVADQLTEPELRAGDVREDPAGAQLCSSGQSMHVSHAAAGAGERKTRSCLGSAVCELTELLSTWRLAAIAISEAFTVEGM